jgi:hypothetical protein
VAVITDGASLFSASTPAPSYAGYFFRHLATREQIASGCLEGMLFHEIAHLKGDSVFYPDQTELVAESMCRLEVR